MHTRVDCRGRNERWANILSPRDDVGRPCRRDRSGGIVCGFREELLARFKSNRKMAKATTSDKKKKKQTKQTKEKLKLKLKM